MKKILNASFNDYPKILEKITNNIKKALWDLGKNAFLFILIFILLEVCFAEILFYMYIISANKEPEAIAIPAKFQKNIYDSLLKQWDDRDNIFKNQSQENYPDPFK